MKPTFAEIEILAVALYESNIRAMNGATHYSGWSDMLRDDRNVWRNRAMKLIAEHEQDRLLDYYETKWREKSTRDPS